MPEQEYYCVYLKKPVDPGLCYDMQMICGGFINPSALPDITLDKEDLFKCCNECKYNF